MNKMKQNIQPFQHVTIREGETFKVNNTNANRHTFREVVATRESKYGRRTEDGTWNTANGFGWIEYRQYGNTGRGRIDGCDSYDWVRMLERMSQVTEVAR